MKIKYAFAQEERGKISAKSAFR